MSEVEYSYTCVMIICSGDMHHSTLSSCMNTSKQGVHSLHDIVKINIHALQTKCAL